jgi:RNA polymerase sigma-70 factor (ECF subfamily)
MAKASVPQVEVSLTSHGEPNDSFAPSQVPGRRNNGEIHSDPQGVKMVRHDWSDDDLARRLHEHDPEALETLISRYSREVFYFIRLVLDGVGVAQDAEECVNDLFVAVWQEIDTFDPGRGTLRTWLTMRAKYIALDRRRQLCRRQTYNWQPADENRQWHSSDSKGNYASFGWGGDEHDNRVSLPPHPEANMEHLLEQSERREELRLALATLPELDRRLIILRYFKYASTEELAAQTGLTRHAVDTRLWRARKSLREVLKEHAYDYERI